MVTGAGKTVLALEAFKRALSLYPDLRVRVVVPTIALANQWRMALLDHAETEEWRPGFFGGTGRDDPSRRVMVYVINSARNTLAGHIRADLSLGRHVLLICDECHHYQSPQNRKIFGFLGPDMPGRELYLSLGLSATPFGTENDQILKEGLGEEIYSYGFEEAADQGVIADYRVCEVSADFLPDERALYEEYSLRITRALIRLYKAHPDLKTIRGRKEFLRRVSALAREADMDPEDPAADFLLNTYLRKEVTVLAMSRIRCCLAILRSLRETDRVLIFSERISQAEDLRRAVSMIYDRRVGIYHSEMNRQARERILEAFRNRQIRILVSCRALDEGIDVPDANIGIVMSSSAVSRQRIQRMGRIIRKDPGKAAASLYYMYIRESSEDVSYLQGLSCSRRTALRYFSREDVFSNDLYEFAALQILEEAGERGYGSSQLSELRRCLTEGLARTDHLLAPETCRDLARRAGDVHERNYWKVCRKMAEMFAD